MDGQIVYNSVTCLECNETIVSYHRHDYKICECPNGAMVDGGTAYLRYGAKDMSKIKLFAVYADDDYELVRKYATRGSRGVDGKKPLTWIPLCDMDDDHLEACLDYGGPDWHMELIRKEIAYRKFKEDQKENIIELMNMDSYSEQNIPESGIKRSDELKGCACYGSNALHPCFCNEENGKIHAD